MMLTTHYPRISEFQTLEELRAYHNERFIRLAYRTILGREPDPYGLTHYLAVLRKTISSEDMLAELRNSQEANACFGNIKSQLQRNGSPCGGFVRKLVQPPLDVMSLMLNIRKEIVFRKNEQAL